jgi:hypothetical protein
MWVRIFGPPAEKLFLKSATVPVRQSARPNKQKCGHGFSIRLWKTVSQVSNCTGAANVLDPVKQRCGHGFSVRRRKNCFSNKQLCRCG